MERSLPIGVELSEVERGAHVRVWAPTHARVTLVLPDREVALAREAGGYHGALVPGLGAGARYRFRLGDDPALHPDPASRFQPEGPHGPSEIVDPSAFAWSDAGWSGVEPHRHVLYELHVGTFTPEGTWAAAAAQLAFLAEVGITTIELMPVAECAGTRNWGYDGVNLFAPTRNYGTPDDMRRFVDRAHAVGLAVILDVVYNHFGPEGNAMFAWSPHYKSAAATEWGEAIDFDGPDSAGVREYFVANARYWIDEFHLDGLRLDATQSIVDRSPVHVLAEITRAARGAAAGRRIFLVGENEPQDAALLAPPIELDALWNDDYHHSARVALTGVTDGYLHDYRGTPQELISAVKRGFLFQGQMYPWQANPRGTPTRGVAPWRFVHFLENHDQVANIGFGERLAAIADPALVRALTALTLLGPALPMLFQGQEHGSRRPWDFFVDLGEALRDSVRRGRATFVAQFARLATADAQARLVDPTLEATYRACVLDPAERTLAHPVVQLHRDLLHLRREVIEPDVAVDGAVLDEHAFALRWFGAHERLLLVNLGRQLAMTSVAEPLLAPLARGGWRLAWSSEDPRYGGHGTPPIFERKRFALPARAACLLVPDPSASLRLDPAPPSGDKDPTRIWP